MYFNSFYNNNNCNNNYNNNNNFNYNYNNNYNNNFNNNNFNNNNFNNNNFNNNNFNNNNFNNNNFNNNNFNNTFYGNNNFNYGNNNNRNFMNNNNNANNMMMDNFQMTMINFMNNFMKAYENMNNINNFSRMQFERQTEVQNTGVVGGLLPRKKTTENYDPFYDFNGQKFNVFFQTPVGYKVNMVVPYNAKLEEVLFKYVTKVGVGPDTIDKDIYFLFGGNKIKKNEKRTAQEIGMIDGSIVIVLDKKGIIGS